MFCSGGGNRDYQIGVNGADFVINDVTSGTSEKLKITSDGRGLSQFTAKVWAYIDGTGTLELKDGHNVSSLTDNGTGNYTINFSNNLANALYCPTTANSAEAQWGEMLAPNTRAVGSMSFTNTDENGTNYDSSRMWVTIFGD